GRIHPRNPPARRSFATSVGLPFRFERLRRFGLLIRSDRIFAGGPFAQIDHLAALAAERSPDVFRCERCPLTTARAGRACGLSGLHNTQHCSWNGMSCDDCKLRALTSFSTMKRMVKRWRPALISG